MRVRVDSFEDQGPMTLVLGQDVATGERVAFRLPTEDANAMQAQIEAGYPVEAELPDLPGPGQRLKKVGEIHEVRRQN